MTQPSFTQVTFRLRNDDGSESGASWRQVQGADDTLLTDTNYRCRFRIDETASRAWSGKVWNLFYSLNSGTYTQAGSGQPVNLSLSNNFVQGDDCTEQLTGGTGTFVADNNGMCESSGATNSGTAGYLFEVEYCFQINSAYVANGDNIVLRVYDGTTAIAAYTDSPSITVSEPIRITLDTALLTVGKVSPSVVEGAVSIIFDTSLLALSGQTITVSASAPEANVQLYTALLSITPVAADVVGGAVAVVLDTSLLQSYSVGLSVIEGAAIIQLGTGVIGITGNGLTIDSGATSVTVIMDTVVLQLAADRLTVILYQILNPNADTSLGSWTDQDFGVVNIYQSIDEDVPSDLDYVQSPSLPAANTYKFKLESGGDPIIHTHHIISIRLKKPYAVGTLSLTVRLLEGATVRATRSESVTDTWTTIEEELTEVEAAAITDYTNLYVELEAVSA